MTIEEIGDRILDDVDEILRRWDAIVKKDEPWSRLRPDRRIDNLPPLIVELARTSLAQGELPDSCRSSMRAAAAHGVERRASGLSEDVLLREYYYVRNALWHYIVAIEPDPERRLEAIGRIDVAISLATTASLFGFHRAEIEGRRDWHSALDRIARSSPLCAVGREDPAPSS